MKWKRRFYFTKEKFSFYLAQYHKGSYLKQYAVSPALQNSRLTMTWILVVVNRIHFIHMVSNKYVSPQYDILTTIIALPFPNPQLWMNPQLNVKQTYSFQKKKCKIKTTSKWYKESIIDVAHRLWYQTISNLIYNSWTIT